MRKAYIPEAEQVVIKAHGLSACNLLLLCTGGQDHTILGWIAHQNAILSFLGCQIGLPDAFENAFQFGLIWQHNSKIAQPE